MKNRIFTAVLMFLVTFALQFTAYAASDAGKVVFYDQNGQSGSFNSAAVQSLGLKVKLAQALKNYKFDFVQVVISPSYNPKMEWRRGWMANEVSNGTLSQIALIPKNSKLVNGYGTPFMIEDIREYPSAKGYDSVTLSAKVRIFTKTGERKETRWDKMKEKYVTETIFQWDEGRQIAAGSAEFSVPKISEEGKKAIEEDKAQKLEQLNKIRKRMGRPPLTKLP